MALRISLSSSPAPRCSPSPSPPLPPSSSSLCLNPAFKWASRRATGVADSGLSKAAAGRGGRALMVRSSSLETEAPAVGQVTDVNKDTFWPLVKAAGSKIVVLDMYTQWCGPCKVIAPKFQELSEKHLDVVFLRLDCNQENRPLAKELGIRVVPTFKILKDSKVVKEVTGAKLDDLVAAIETAKSS
ncbi:thioredoxin F, chloroplastic-like [Phoenix dactylifera]|uniref:Thioredoxin F, chloroplastic-like n=1 Tax=Phoenix dactylifera TaxID=42345 RepID=A0A8B7BY26_PHODC|nr:thioredoxin F, chloroplastic-like [Phoenix dactylifera]